MRSKMSGAVPCGAQARGQQRSGAGQGEARQVRLCLWWQGGDEERAQNQTENKGPGSHVRVCAFSGAGAHSGEAKSWAGAASQAQSRGKPPSQRRQPAPTWLLGSSDSADTIIQRYGVLLRWCWRLPAGRAGTQGARRGVSQCVLMVVVEVRALACCGAYASTKASGWLLRHHGSAECRLGRTGPARQRGGRRPRPALLCSPFSAPSVPLLSASREWRYLRLAVCTLRQQERKEARKQAGRGWVDRRGDAGPGWQAGAAAQVVGRSASHTCRRRMQPTAADGAESGATHVQAKCVEMASHISASPALSSRGSSWARYVESCRRYRRRGTAWGGT